MGFKKRAQKDRPERIPDRNPRPMPRIARSSDAYYWLSVTVTRTGRGSENVKIWIQGQDVFNRTFKEVLWHWGEHFDPDFIWSSHYPKLATGGYAGGFVGCPKRYDLTARKGFLLVNKNQSGVEKAMKLQASSRVITKWPISAG